MKKRIISLVLAAVMALSLVACGGNDTNGTDRNTNDTTVGTNGDSGETGGEKLAAQQTVTAHWTASNFYSFDNNKNYASEEFLLQSHVLEGLVRAGMDENGTQTYEPAGAESWTVSDDGRVWTFKLREYYWSDGVQVTAQHFVDSFCRLGDPRNGFDFAFFLDDIVGGTELYSMDADSAASDIEAAMEALGVKALDDTTLEVTLNTAASQFLSKLSVSVLFPVRLDIIESADEMYDTDYTTHVWCGPFTVSDYVKDNSITLVKNEQYWDAENVKLTEIDLINIDEASTQSTMFKSGELAVLAPSGDYVSAYRDGAESGDYTFYTSDAPNVTYFYFNRGGNSTSGLMESKKVRLALSLAANREEFTDTIFGRYTPAYGFVPYGVTVGTVDFRATYPEPLKELAEQYDTDEKLQALFKEGMAELGDTRELSDVTITYICRGDTAIKRQQQEYWKALWEQRLGINVIVNVLGDSSLLSAERQAGNYDIGQAGWNGDYNDPMAFLEMWASYGTSVRYSGWTKELGDEFDQFVEQLNQEGDSAKRAAIYAEAEKWVVCDEVAAIAYMYTDNIYCISNSVKGIVCPFVGPSFDFTYAYVVE